MKNSNDTIGIRTRDLPTCRAVPQPNALPRARNMNVLYINPDRFYYGMCLVGNDVKLFSISGFATNEVTCELMSSLF